MDNNVHCEQYSELIRDCFRGCVSALCGNKQELQSSRIASICYSMQKALSASIENGNAADIKKMKYVFGAMVILLTTDKTEEVYRYLSPASLAEIGIK